MFPPPGTPGGGKMKHPGNDVGSKGPQRELSWHLIRYYASKSWQLRDIWQSANFIVSLTPVPLRAENISSHVNKIGSGYLLENFRRAAQSFFYGSSPGYPATKSTFIELKSMSILGFLYFFFFQALVLFCSVESLHYPICLRIWWQSAMTRYGVHVLRNLALFLISSFVIRVNIKRYDLKGYDERIWCDMKCDMKWYDVTRYVLSIPYKRQNLLRLCSQGFP